MKHTGLTGLTEEIATFGNLQNMQRVNQRKLEKNGIAIERNASVYHDKDSKTHWNDPLKAQETAFIKNIHIMY